MFNITAVNHEFNDISCGDTLILDSMSLDKNVGDDVINIFGLFFWKSERLHF